MLLPVRLSIVIAVQIIYKIGGIFATSFRCSKLCSDKKMFLLTMQENDASLSSHPHDEQIV